MKEEIEDSFCQYCVYWEWAPKETKCLLPEEGKTCPYKEAQLVTEHVDLSSFDAVTFSFDNNK